MCGCEYLFLYPADTTAAEGDTAFKKDSDVEESLPWWPSFNISLFKFFLEVKMSFSFWYSASLGITYWKKTFWVNYIINKDVR